MSNINNSARELRRSVGEKSIEAFARMYFQHYLTNNACSFHKDLYSILFEMTKMRGKNTAVAAPRRSAKSSIVSLIYIIWAICYKKEEYILLISDTSKQATTLLSHIKTTLETNQSLIEDFPEACEAGQSGQSICWKEYEIITRNGVKITALGSDQKIRGRRYKEFRPTLIIADDMENDCNTESQDQREKLFNWFAKAVLNAGNEKTNIVVIGTILHFDSLLARLTSDADRSKWKGMVYRSVISFAAKQDLWLRWSRVLNYNESYKEKEGKEAADLFFKDNDTAMLEGSEVLWPEEESYYSLMLKKDNNEVAFNSEKQNSPSNPAERSFNMEEAYYWDRNGMTEQELLDKLGKNVVMVGACDPSFGAKGKSADYSAIVTIAYDSATGTGYVLDADIQKRELEKLYEGITALCYKWRYSRFGIEGNSAQIAIINEVKRRCSEQNIDVELESISNYANKESRIRVLQSPIKTGRIQFSLKHHELLQQLKYFPKGSHDDGPDALEMAYIGICQGILTHRVSWLPLVGGDKYIPGNMYFDRHEKFTKDPDAREYGDSYIIDTDDDDDD
jgi:predicted phage terminase large subunit-like protein